MSIVRYEAGQWRVTITEYTKIIATTWTWQVFFKDNKIASGSTNISHTTAMADAEKAIIAHKNRLQTLMAAMGNLPGQL